jgi:hypothetical protein
MENNEKDTPNDMEIAVAVAKNITPLVEGLTLVQVEICFDQIYSAIRSSSYIKFKE